MLLLLSFLEKISPLELTFMWLLRSVSNQPLPDRCDDIIAKDRTALHLHSSLEIKNYVLGIKQTRLLNLTTVADLTCCKLSVEDSAQIEPPKEEQWTYYMVVPQLQS
jgi:hypothetical protein